MVVSVINGARVGFEPALQPYFPDPATQNFETVRCEDAEAEAAPEVVSASSPRNQARFRCVRIQLVLSAGQVGDGADPVVQSSAVGPAPGTRSPATAARSGRYGGRASPSTAPWSSRRSCRGRCSRAALGPAPGPPPSAHGAGRSHIAQGLPRDCGEVVAVRGFAPALVGDLQGERAQFRGHTRGQGGNAEPSERVGH